MTRGYRAERSTRRDAACVPPRRLVRARSLDKSLDSEMNKQPEALGRRADALCPRLGSLDALQCQFQFRL